MCLLVRDRVVARDVLHAVAAALPEELLRCFPSVSPHSRARHEVRAVQRVVSAHLTEIDEEGVVLRFAVPRARPARVLVLQPQQLALQRLLVGRFVLHGHPLVHVLKVVVA